MCVLREMTQPADITSSPGQRGRWKETVHGLTWRDMPGATDTEMQRLNFALWRRGILKLSENELQRAHARATTRRRWEKARKPPEFRKDLKGSKWKKAEAHSLTEHQLDPHVFGGLILLDLPRPDALGIGPRQKVRMTDGQREGLATRVRLARVRRGCLWQDMPKSMGVPMTSMWKAERRVGMFVSERAVRLMLLWCHEVDGLGGFSEGVELRTIHRNTAQTDRATARRKAQQTKTKP